MQSPRLSIYILVFKRVYLRGKSVAFFLFIFLPSLCVLIGVLRWSALLELWSRAESPGLRPEVILHLASIGPVHPGEGERRPVLKRISLLHAKQCLSFDSYSPHHPLLRAAPLIIVLKRHSIVSHSPKSRLQRKASAWAWTLLWVVQVCTPSDSVCMNQIFVLWGV